MDQIAESRRLVIWLCGGRVVDRVLKKVHKLSHFVLWHVDELMSPEQAKLIIDNADNHCPAGLSTLCKRLSAKAKKPD